MREVLQHHALEAHRLDLPQALHDLLDGAHRAAVRVPLEHVLRVAAEARRDPPRGFLDVAVVPPDDVYDTECDIYSPCAIGGTLNATTIPRLRCKIVGGSANNQLAEPEDARRLHERGILYAPDFIINAGGIIQLYLLEDQGATEEQMLAKLHAVGDTLREIYARGGDPADAAEELAAERIAQKRDEALA